MGTQTLAIYKLLKGISIGGTAIVGFDILTNDFFNQSIKLGEGESKALIYVVIAFWVATGIMKIIKFFIETKRDIESFEIEKKERNQLMKEKEIDIAKDKEELIGLKNNHSGSRKAKE